MPALERADGSPVFEADVILRYLEDRYADNKALTPSTPEARQAMNLMIRIHDLYVRRVDIPRTGSRRRRGWDVDIPRRRITPAAGTRQFGRDRRARRTAPGDGSPAERERAHPHPGQIAPAALYAAAGVQTPGGKRAAAAVHVAGLPPDGFCAPIARRP